MELKWLLPLCLLIAGCARDQWDDCFTSTGPMSREERTIGDFHTVDLSDRIDLVLEARDEGPVVVVGGGELLDQVVTEVDNGVLQVRNENRCNWVRSYVPRITVRVPITSVGQLTLRGSGSVNGLDTIRRERFVVEQWGGEGTVSLVLDVEELTCALHTGVGDVRLNGRCGEVADLYSGVIGAIDAAGLRTPVVNVNNSGVAVIRCWAEERLAVTILARGDVYYRGSPTEVATDLQGSGRLLRLE
jgi:hypothetical protein